MHIPSHLSLSRHNVYYYRYPIPANLHPEGKQSHIRLSLRTSNERLAMYTAHRLSYYAEKLTLALHDTCMDYDEIRAAIKNGLTKLVNDSKAERTSSGPYDRNKRKSLEEWVRQYSDYDVEDFSGRDMLAANASRKVSSVVPNLELQSCDREEFTKEFIRQYPKALQAILDHDENPQDLEFTESSGSGLLITEAIQRYTDEQTRAGEENWKPNTQREKKTHFALLLEILGESSTAGAFTRPTAEDIKNILLHLPQNRKKDTRTRELTLKEAIEIQGPKKLASSTINKYLDSYSGLGDWLKNHGHIPENPFTGMKLKTKKTLTNRDAFDVQETRVILVALQTAKIREHRKQFRYWGPLIGAYTGARIGEITQLYIDDISQKDGIWYFNFNETRNDQNLKTSCERKIPIHRTILDAGFLEYLERLKRQKQERVFPQLTYDGGKQGYGRKLSHWFNQVFLKDLELKTDKLVFHSLRHTVTTQLYEAGVSDYLIKKILGHSQGDTTNAFYNKSENLKQMKEALERLPY